MKFFCVIFLVTTVTTITTGIECVSFISINLIKYVCKLKYIEETGRILKFRLDEHRGYVNTEDKGEATGAPFNPAVQDWLILGQQL